MDDWADDSQVDGAYSVDCLQEALGRVSEDIRVYSTFEEQVQQARHLAVVARTTGQPSTMSDEGPEPGSGSTDARSIPLPLLVLAALAVALVGAGTVTLTARKLRARLSRGQS